MSDELTPEQQQTLIGARDEAIAYFAYRSAPATGASTERDLAYATTIGAVSLALAAHTLSEIGWLIQGLSEVRR